MSPSRFRAVTGSDAGYTGEDQVRICLQKIVDLGGVAPIQDLYAAMEAVLNPQGLTLSSQGKSSLRFFVNRKAVEWGYVYPHDKENPGWRITPEGREWLDGGEDDGDGNGDDNGVGLLAYIDKLLDSLPVIDPERLSSADSTTLTIEGPPAKIQATVQAMMDFAYPGEVLIKLTLNHKGWHVLLDAHPEENR